MVLAASSPMQRKDFMKKHIGEKYVCHLVIPVVERVWSQWSAHHSGGKKKGEVSQSHCILMKNGREATMASVALFSL